MLTLVAARARNIFGVQNRKTRRSFFKTFSDMQWEFSKMLRGQTERMVVSFRKTSRAQFEIFLCDKQAFWLVHIRMFSCSHVGFQVKKLKIILGFHQILTSGRKALRPVHPHSGCVSFLCWWVCVSRLGIWRHHPSGPPSQVVGAGGEDVPHQQEETLGPDEETRPAEDGGSQEGRTSPKPNK